LCAQWSGREQAAKRLYLFADSAFASAKLNLEPPVTLVDVEAAHNHEGLIGRMQPATARSAL